MTSEDVGLVYYTQVPKTVIFVGAQNTIPLELARPFDHVPIRPNKRRFKPTNPANKRSRRKITQ